MNLSYVETFYWAATLHSITDAAKKMHIVPQAASQRIRVLERELKTRLIVRKEGQFRLTRMGERFLVDATRLLVIWREIQGELGLSADAARTLRIGAMESVLHAWLIPWIERLRRDWPKVELELTVETTEGLHGLVKRGAIDLVFSADPFHTDGVCTRALSALPMIFVGDRSRHVNDSYVLAELANHGILTFQRGSQPYVRLQELLRQQNIASARVHAISSVSAMLRLVELGFGVATLPLAVIEQLSERQHGLKPLRCDSQLSDLTVYASWRSDPSSTLMDNLVDSASAFISEQTGLVRLQKLTGSRPTNV
jgi:DNA-binding transcriptional LysR family regulator